MNTTKRASNAVCSRSAGKPGKDCDFARTARNGRHNRVHLVIGEAEFVDLFRDAVAKGVFHAQTLQQLRAILTGGQDRLPKVIGIAQDGQLTKAIDNELYGGGSS
jgi:hypothetical protein